MTDAGEVRCHAHRKRTLWFLVGLGAVGAALAVARLAYRGGLPDPWTFLGTLIALVGTVSLHAVTVRVDADAYGVRIRTVLRRRSLPWSDIADLRVRLKYATTPRVQETRRVSLLLRDGREQLLPLPHSWSPDDPDFDRTLAALRALHSRYGAPESNHVPVISARTAGRGWAGSLGLCVLLLAAAAVTAWFVPYTASQEREWRSAAPCTAETPAAERGECLSTQSAVIARTEARAPKKSSWLYFSDSRPLRRLGVSREAAQEFQPGDKVQLALWRGQVREVAGARHVWREHITGAGDLAVLAAGFALAAGYPEAQAMLRLRGRRLPDDEILPSALPFAGALVGTALWLLPLCYLHPTTLFTSRTAVSWAAAGTLASSGLFVWAWRATGVRRPVDSGTSEESDETRQEEVFLAARFLEHTDYNPYGFGTHIVLGGGGPPAVTPHPGPDRFAAKPIPMDRLTLRDLRRPRGSDGDTVPRSWHIAELDDAGTLVRLAAAPADLTRILRELGLALPSSRVTSPPR
ncbi:PH domain-containing protein [Streptomyces sp. NPDC006332]|uniref:PH domain-containing protein n=1 Tax=Streptomyces sp. NPDC006332 TaxID=3155456 RepID=UPI0033A67CA9